MLVATQSFGYSDFANVSDLALNGNAQSVVTSDGSVLRLVPATRLQTASVYYGERVNVSRFSTRFSFRITSPGGIQDIYGSVGGDGFTFLVQSDMVTAMGGPGETIAFDGISPSAGFEFDTYGNSAQNDTGSNQVAGIVNGSVSHGAWNPPLSITPNLDDGLQWFAWVDYDGVMLELRVSQSRTRPTPPTQSYPIDLPQSLGTSNAWVGFTSATYNAFANFDILRWEFSSPALSLGMAGSCPGLVQFRVEHAEPGSLIAFLYSPGEGLTTIPSRFPCTGTFLGLTRPITGAGLVRAGPLGRATLSARIPPSACGATVVQALNLHSCRVSRILSL
jgi:hypothetical protein